RTDQPDGLDWTGLRCARHRRGAGRDCRGARGRDTGRVLLQRAHQSGEAAGVGDGRFCHGVSEHLGAKLYVERLSAGACRDRAYVGSNAASCDRDHIMPKVQPASNGTTGRLGRGRRVTTSLAEINVVPLVDVMLVLLVIFMITAPMIQRGIDVKL